ncbi:MAG: VOC family protein [Bacteroidales bacterium]|nr:VOC family protein [Bacteroidales bacterium]
MILEHIGIWTNKLEALKNYYVTYFDGVPNDKYTNEKNQFFSYFITFKSGARLEIMNMPGLPDKTNDTLLTQHQGIFHLAFGLNSKQEVDNKARQLVNGGFKIFDGPRITGDGYYEFVTLDPDGNRIEVTAKYTGW